MRRESEPFTDRSPITVAGSASVRHYPPMSYQGRDRRWCRWVLRRQKRLVAGKGQPESNLALSTARREKSERKRTSTRSVGPFPRNRWFESCSLQGRVWCEPDFRGRSPSMTVAHE